MEPRVPSVWGRVRVLVVLHAALSFVAAYAYLAATGLTEHLSVMLNGSEEEIAAGGKVEKGPDIETGPRIHEVLN